METEGKYGSDKGIFQAYMMQYLTDYTSMEHISDPLRYQLEYVIGGKTTDQENLKAVVYRLLAAREAANMMYLTGSDQTE